jgi:pumilio homology domain family member 6
MAIKENNKRKSKAGAGSSGGGDGFSKKQKSTSRTTTSDATSNAQKRDVRKERQSHRRHADAVAEAKILWNKLRVKSNTPEDTKELMDQVMSLIRGKVAEIALQHDASRVVQAAIQFGSDSERRELLNELCASEEGSLVELAKIQYAHFCCLKFIKYCNRDDQCMKMIIKVRKTQKPKQILIVTRSNKK